MKREEQVRKLMEVHGRDAYAAYVKAVYGKQRDGELPTWSELTENEKVAWIEASVAGYKSIDDQVLPLPGLDVRKTERDMIVRFLRNAATSLSWNYPRSSMNAAHELSMLLNRIERGEHQS